MSHGDQHVKMLKGFKFVVTNDQAMVTPLVSVGRRLYGFQRRSQVYIGRRVTGDSGRTGRYAI